MKSLASESGLNTCLAEPLKAWRRLREPTVVNKQGKGSQKGKPKKKKSQTGDLFWLW